MLGFKRYLQEAKLPADYFAPWHITSQAEFDAISTDPSNDHYGAFMRNAKFNADGSVRITLKDYTTRGWDEVKGEHNVLPFKFSTGKNVEIKDVKSLWGAPDKAEELNINSVRLTSLEHLNIELNGYLFIEAPNATELKCSVTQKYSHTAVVFKEFKSFEKKDFMTSMQEIKKVGFRDATTEILKNTGVLMFLKMPKLENVYTYSNSSVNVGKEYVDVMKTVCKYLEGNRSLLSCQEELINNGHKKYAKL